MTKKSSSKTPMEVLVTLVCTALLIALQVVLSRFLSIQAWNIKIGFSFVPVMIAARLFGPIGSIAVYAVGDVIGTLLFPTGAYFPGFTLSAAISGLIFGLFLYKKSSAAKIALSVFLNQLICSFLLNSFCIHYISHAPYTSLLATRWVQSLGMGIVMIVLMSGLLERICAQIEKSVFLRLKSRPVASAKKNDSTV